MLSNAYFLAKIRFDAAENEPAKNLQKISKNFNNCCDDELTQRLTAVSGGHVAALPHALFCDLLPHRLNRAHESCHSPRS